MLGIDIILGWGTGLPSTLWYVPLFFLVLLGFVSFVDARTGRVPDLPLLLGGFVAIAALAWGTGWANAGVRLLYAVGAVVSLRLLNEGYYRLFGHDAFGFGDVKWTGLAVAGFGLVSVCWAWVFGAWLGVIWLGLRAVWRKVSPTYAGHAYVHFAPFLFLGLLVALFRDRLVGLFF